MRAQIVHVTDHALLRWKQRVSNGESFTVHDIINCVRAAAVIKRSETLPFNTVRQPNTVYAQFQEVLFICEPIGIDEYKVITVITYSETYTVKIRKLPKVKKEFDTEELDEQPKKKTKRKARNKRILIEDHLD